MSDTVPCRVAVLGVAPIRGAGRLAALAEVEIEVAGVALLLRGVQVVEGPIGREVRAPQFRDTRGQWAPAIVLPPELHEAMHGAVLDAADAAGPRPPNPYARGGCASRR